MRIEMVWNWGIFGILRGRGGIIECLDRMLFLQVHAIKNFCFVVTGLVVGGSSSIDCEICMCSAMIFLREHE